MDIKPFLKFSGDIIMKLLSVIFSLLFLPIILFSSSYHLYKEFEVGKYPIAIIYDEQSGYHIYCDRYDSNFNGIFEPELGETKSSWWHISYPQSDNEAQLLKEFDWEFTTGFSTGCALRPAIQDGIIYFNTTTGVYPYRLSNAELIENRIVPIGCNAVSIFENKMYLSVRHIPEGEYVADTNYVIVYDMQNKVVTDTLPAIANVQQVLCFAKNTFNYDYYLLVLNEGFMGGNDSKLQVYKIYEDSYDLIKVIDLGDTGNNMIYDGVGNIYVAMNMSHQIQVISTDSFAISKSIPVPTSGYDGPRQICKFEEEIVPLKQKKNDPIPQKTDTPFMFCVSTYSGNVYIYYDDNLIDYVETTGKLEGVLSEPFSGIGVTNAFQKGTYTADNRVSFYTSWTSVTDKVVDNSLFSVYPNPASNFINISCDNSLIESIELISLQGKTIFQKQLNNENSYVISLESLNLPNGLYFLKILSGNAISNYLIIIK